MSTNETVYGQKIGTAELPRGARDALIHQEYAGFPNGNVTPDWVGQELHDTTNNIFYRAIGVTNTSWVAAGNANRPATGTPVFFKTGAAPAAKSTDGTLTAAEVFAGTIIIDDGGGATSTQTLPTGTQMSAAAPSGITVGDSFFLFVINQGTTAAELAVIAAGVGFTLVGSGTIEELDAATNPSSATFVVRYAAANTWTATRVG